MTKSETQLTLKEQEDRIYVLVAKFIKDAVPQEYHAHYADTDDNSAEFLRRDLLALFTQALTSVKSEMEKKKRKTNDTWLDSGWNEAISECQRVIDNYSPSLRQDTRSDGSEVSQ